MKQLDYARLAEDCSRQADAMKPGPERDALIAKAKQYRSYAKMENWIVRASAAFELTNSRSASSGRTFGSSTPPYLSLVSQWELGGWVDII